MPNALAHDARALSDRELAEAILETYREVFNLRFQKGTRQLTNPMAMSVARRRIARLRTIQQERRLAVVRGEPAPAPAAPSAALSPQKRRALERRAAAAAAIRATAETEASGPAPAGDTGKAE